MQLIIKQNKYDETLKKRIDIQHTVLFDESDLSVINSHKWLIINGYVGTYSGQKKKRVYSYLHRMLMNTPIEMQVDHINHNKLDNQRVNLRNVTPEENQRNKKRINSGRVTSCFKGVYWERSCNRWRVQISVKNKTKHIGVFKDEIGAAKAYDEAIRKEYGEICVTNFKPESFEDCLKTAAILTKEYKEAMAPETVFATPPINGGDYNAPRPQETSAVLQDYTRYLPGLLQATTAALPGVAQGQLDATRLTQPGYNQLNLDQARQFGVPLAQVGQQVADSNAQAGAATNLRQIQGAGGQAAGAAMDLSRRLNPDYWNPQDAASRQATNLVNSYDLGGLSPGEAAATERSTNQGNQGTGNLGLSNPTNTVSNAMNFGAAFDAKRQALGQALGTATGVAQGAQNNGTNTTNIALGQPNVSTAGNFGTGTFTNTNSNTNNATTGNAFSFGSGALGDMFGANNAAIASATSMANANSVPAYLGATGQLLGGL